MSPEPILSSSQFHKRFKNTHRKTHHPHAENREQTPNILKSLSGKVKPLWSTYNNETIQIFPKETFETEHQATTLIFSSAACSFQVSGNQKMRYYHSIKSKPQDPELGYCKLELNLIQLIKRHYSFNVMCPRAMPDVWNERVHLFNWKPTLASTHKYTHTHTHTHPPNKKPFGVLLFPH